MSARCPKCNGALEPTVLSGVVSLKRRRAVMATGRVSAVRAETCTDCGFTEFYAARPERLFADIRPETS